MPIVIDDLIDQIQQTNTTQKDWTPKYFHKDLNGKGTSTSGRINVNTHPAKPDTTFQPDPLAENPHKFTDTDENLEIRYIPVTPVSYRTYYSIADYAAQVADIRHEDATNNGAKAPQDIDQHPYFLQRPTPDPEGMFNINDALNVSIDNYTFFADFDPERVSIRKKKTVATDGSSSIDTATHVDYHVRVVAVHDDDLTLIKHPDGSQEYDIDPETISQIFSHNLATRIGDVKSFSLSKVTDTPFDTMQELMFTAQDILDSVNAYHSASIDRDAFNVWSADEYSLYDRISENAKIMGTDAVAEHVNSLITQLDYFTGEEERIRGSYESHRWNPILRQLRRMEFFDVTLTAYSDIFDTLNKLRENEVGIELTKHNLQLSFNANLKTLVGVKDQLPVPLAQGQQTAYVPDPKFSQQQLAPITTQSPLVMVKAGAGTGKTTVILEHVHFLVGCGVDLRDIEAWSFTNAAADNMSERFPGIQSSTIAKAYMDIYEYNFPSHKLSNMETILTSLQIYYGEAIGMDDTLSTFYRLIKDGMKQTNASMTALANFTEANLAPVISILNEIRQTSLELALIISYLMIDEPSFKSNRPTPKYLIIDEVQDNSVFEFVYALKYATRNRCAIFVVGDPSQTLYEFRSANPKALNSLEMSGVFDTFALTTNYRSNQEILDFANVHLRDIETNKVTQIELKANMISSPTEETFTDKVQMFTVHGVNQQQFTEEIGQYFRSQPVKDFIDSKLKAGERVCILGARRVEVSKAHAVLEKMYPNTEIVNLTAERPFNNTTFSKFVASYWNTVTAVEPKFGALTFQRELIKNLSRFEHDAVRAEPRIRKMLVQWWLSVEQDYLGWVSRYDSVLNNPSATQDDIERMREWVFGNLRESILAYEIRHNAINQSLKSKRNEDRKTSKSAQNSPLIVSTIHGAKGLEFDNTIVIHKPKATLDEDEKRMFYVAFTRAQKAEMIIAGSGAAQSKIISDYENIVDMLHTRDAKLAAIMDNQQLQGMLNARGIDPADVDITATLRNIGTNDNVIDENVFVNAVVMRTPNAASGAINTTTPDTAIPNAPTPDAVTPDTAVPDAATPVDAMSADMAPADGNTQAPMSLPTPTPEEDAQQEENPQNLADFLSNFTNEDDSNNGWG